MGYTRSLTVSFLCYSVVILPAESGTCFTSRFIKRMWGPNFCCSEREMIMSQSIGIPLGRGRMWSRSWLTVPSSLRWIVKNGTSQAKHIAAPSCEISEEVSQGSLGYLCAQRKARRREIPNRQTVKLSNGSTWKHLCLACRKIEETARASSTLCGDSWSHAYDDFQWLLPKPQHRFVASPKRHKKTWIDRIDEGANILKQVAEDAPDLKTSNYSLTLSYPFNTLCTPQKHANKHEGGKWWPNPAVAKPPFTLSCFCYLPTRKYYFYMVHILIRQASWNRNGDIRASSSWAFVPSSLRRGAPEFSVRTSKGVGKSRSLLRVWTLRTSHWLFSIHSLFKIWQWLFSLLPTLVALSLCVILSNWCSCLIGRLGLLSLSWLVQGSGRLLDLVGHGRRNQM